MQLSDSEVDTVADRTANSAPLMQQDTGVSIILAVLLALSAPARSAVHSLSRGVDVNSASNLSAMVFFDWDHNGTDEAVGIDRLKKRLIACPLNLTNYFTQAPVVMAENLAAPSYLLVADMNQDQQPDLVVFDGPRVRVWYSRSRTGVVATPADREFSLLVPSQVDYSPPVIDDFDRDGVQDLLLGVRDDPTNFGLLSWRLLFSFGTAQQAVLALPAASARRLAVIAHWTAGGPPVLAYQTNDPDPPREFTIIYQVGPGRVLAEVERVPLIGTAVELDGQAPPEWVELRQSPYDGFSYLQAPMKVVVSRKSGTAWQQWFAETVPLASPLIFNVPPVVADFDNDGREEMVMSSGISSQEADARSHLWLLQTAPASGACEIFQIQPARGLATEMSAVRMPSLNRNLLCFTGPGAFVSDVFGGPARLGGIGTRTQVRFSQLEAQAEDHDVPMRFQMGRSALANLAGSALADLVVIGSVWPEGRWFPSGETAPFPGGPGGYNGLIEDTAAPDSLAVADLTGDGRPDAVSTNGQGSLVVYESSPDNHYGTGGFLFTKRSVLGVSAAGPYAPTRILGVGDFDSDGDQDPLYLRGHDETLCWVANSGTGTLGMQHSIALAGRIWVGGAIGGYSWLTPERVLVTDADGNGKTDIITFPSALGLRMALHRQTAVGFSIEPLGPEPTVEAWNFLNPGVPSLARGHFVADPSAPLQIVLLTPSSDEFGNPGAAAVVYAGTAESMHAGAQTTVNHSGDTLAVVDFDQDGLDDLIIGGGTSMDMFGNPTSTTVVTYHRSRGDGTFGPEVQVAATLGVPTQLAVADLTGDGLPDLLATSAYTTTVELFTNRTNPGIPGFGAWATVCGLANPSPGADPDGDGRSNLLEYAQGTPPNGSAALPPPLSAPTAGPEVLFSNSVGRVTARHPRPRLTDGSRIEVAFESSTDLKRWAPVTAQPWVEVDPGSPEWETLHWNVWNWDPQAFYRFSITRTPPAGP
jgi:hypothetical protein